MSTTYLTQTGSLISGWTSARTTPMYKQVLSWVLLVPLSFLIVDGQFSFTNPSNSAFITQNGNLLHTSQGFRPAVIIYVLVMASFFCIGYRKIWRVAKQNPLLSAGLLLAFLSCAWSTSPMLTLRSSIELTLSTGFAFYLTERFTTEHLMRLLMFAGTLAAIISLFLVFVRPDYGIYHRGGGSEWQGIFSHKNALGVGMAFLLTPVFFVKERLVLKAGYVAVLLFLIAMSQSRGAWFVTLATLMFVAWLALWRRLRRREALLFAILTVLLIAIVTAVGVSNLDPFMRMIGKDPTLTGRTEIYAQVLESISKRPVTGYGFGAFWFAGNSESVRVAQSLGWPNIGYSENGFLELALQLGALGVGLIFIVFWRFIYQCTKLIRSGLYNHRVGWFTVLIFLELATNIEAGIVQGAGNINWTMALIAFVGIANEIKDTPRVNDFVVA